MLLIGAHLRAEDIVDSVERIAIGSLFVSAVVVDAQRSTAEPEMVRLVAEARHALTMRETFVAFRYGARAHSEAEVQELCRPHIERWHTLLERWRGHVELTLKVAPPTKVERPKIDEVSGGADYLRKLAAAKMQPLDEDARTVVERTFAEIASTAKWLARNDGGWEYAVLTPRESLARLGELSQKLRSEMPRAYLLSGPWPLEVFADER